MLDMTHLAARQLRDCDARTPGTMFAKQLSFSEEQAYALQSTICRLREQRGALVIGYKSAARHRAFSSNSESTIPSSVACSTANAGRREWTCRRDDLPDWRLRANWRCDWYALLHKHRRCATCPGVMKAMVSPCRTNFHETRKSGRSAPAGMTTLRLSRSILQAQKKSGRAQSVVLQDSTLRTSLPGGTGDL